MHKTKVVPPQSHVQASCAHGAAERPLILSITSILTCRWRVTRSCSHCASMLSAPVRRTTVRCACCTSTSSATFHPGGNASARLPASHQAPQTLEAKDNPPDAGLRKTLLCRVAPAPLVARLLPNPHHRSCHPTGPWSDNAALLSLSAAATKPLAPFCHDIHVRKIPCTTRHHTPLSPRFVFAGPTRFFPNVGGIPGANGRSQTPHCSLASSVLLPKIGFDPLTHGPFI
jgi:hypothetical protein